MKQLQNQTDLSELNQVITLDELFNHIPLTDLNLIPHDSLEQTSTSQSTVALNQPTLLPNKMISAGVKHSEKFATISATNAQKFDQFVKAKNKERETKSLVHHPHIIFVIPAKAAICLTRTQASIDTGKEVQQKYHKRSSSGGF